MTGSSISDILAPLAQRILLVPVPSEGSATPQELAEACRRGNRGSQITACASLREALPTTMREAFLVARPSSCCPSSRPRRRMSAA